MGYPSCLEVRADVIYEEPSRPEPGHDAKTTVAVVIRSTSCRSGHTRCGRDTYRSIRARPTATLCGAEPGGWSQEYRRGRYDSAGFLNRC